MTELLVGTKKGLFKLEGDAPGDLAGDRRCIGEARGIEREIHRARLEQNGNRQKPDQR